MDTCRFHTGYDHSENNNVNIEQLERISDKEIT
jgi:hypothetical protein